MIWWSSSGTPRGSLAVGLVVLVLGLVFSLIFAIRSPVMGVFVFFGPIFLLGLPFLLSRSRGRGEAGEAAAKPKHGESLSELMSILNEDDVEDLRARVKARLAEQIANANPDEIETFDSLLNTDKHKRG